MKMNFGYKNDDVGYIGFKGIKQEQFGHAVITIQCPIRDILQFIKIDNEVQRQEDTNKVTELTQYIQYGLDGNNIYLTPLIFSARNCGSFDTESNEFRLKFSEKLTLLDGQHRIKAFTNVKKRLETKLGNPEKKEAYDRLLEFPLTLQVYRNLTLKQEKQLFTDINTKSAPVSRTLMIMYGDGGLYGQITREIIASHPSISSEMFEDRGRSTQKKLMTAGTLCYIGALLNEGKLTPSDGKFTINEKNFKSYKRKVEKFLTLLNKYGPMDKLNRNKYVILNPGILMSLAKFIYEVQKEKDIDMEYLFKDIIRNVDWTHNNTDFLQFGTKFNPKTKKINFNANRRTIRYVSEHLLALYKAKAEGVQIEWVQ